MTHQNIKQLEEHPFAQYVRILGKGKKGSRSLTEQEAFDAMSMIMRDEVEDVQIGAFLMLLRVKEESNEELGGFVRAVRDHISTPPSLSVDLDWSSYAGKRRHLPWYLISIFLLSQSGYRTFIHGASGHTSNRLYTENILNELGFKSATCWNDVSQQVQDQGFSYLSLEHISPVLSRLINLRNLMGLRSPVHSLSRLINPLNANTVLQGIFHPPYAPRHQSVGQQMGYHTLAVIKGEGGEIERNPDNEMRVLSTHDGELSEEIWPSMFPRRHLKASEMTAQHLVNVWRGELTDEYGEGAIIGTTALALKYLDSSLSQTTAIDKARSLWNDRNTIYLPNPSLS